MANLSRLRSIEPSIISLGLHQPVLQSMLDFDYYCGREKPTLAAIISAGKKFGKFFWGKSEILIPIFPDIESLPKELRIKANGLLNVSSGRRTLFSTAAATEKLPNLSFGVLFAESVPEKHALEISILAKEKGIMVIGPASVGMIIPGHLKIGPIGGVEPSQLVNANVLQPGNTAIICSSGGMAGELLNVLAQNDISVSFAVAFGGDRFPIFTPHDAFLMAEHDAATRSIVYFGELGGADEYELTDLIRNKKITKPVIAYVAGHAAAAFAEPPQFGHAKALAQKGSETAEAKTKALREAGALVGASYEEFINLLQKNIMKHSTKKVQKEDLSMRKSSLFTSRISADTEGVPTILGQPLVKAAASMEYAHIVASLLLGRKAKSKEMIQLTELALKLLVDHGPQVSGAVNTMITARAGKDLVSAVCAGLLTIGDRFGGAINEAGSNWFSAVSKNTPPKEFVESYASAKKLIAGIGHRKYSVNSPDPRVAEILTFAKKLSSRPHLNFALAVEKITLSKKANLILNVDGALAAVLLDVLLQKEKCSADEIRELLDIEFFNSLFVIARTVGFTAHYLEQRRLDEGLFRLPDDLISK